MNIKKIIKKIIALIYYNFYYKYNSKSGNRILIYHAFGTKLAHDTYGISIDLNLFEEHIKFITDNYSVVSINTINKEINSICITIDDGYKDNIEAVKILEKYKVPYTIYISTGYIDKDINYLTSEDLRMLNQSELCTIGSHTVNHIPLDTISEEEQEFEILNSKEFLEELLSTEINDFSYPHGSYDKRSEQIVKNYYSRVSTSNIGINEINCDIQSLKRIEIVASDSILDLNKKILGYYDYLSK